MEGSKEGRWKGGKEERKGGRKEGMQKGREEERKGAERKGGRKEGREKGRKGERKGGRKGGRQKGREAKSCKRHFFFRNIIEAFPFQNIQLDFPLVSNIH